MRKQLCLLCLASVLIAACGGSPIPANAPASTSTPDPREMTHYSARQAFARLGRYLFTRGQPQITKLWRVLPERGALYDDSSSNASPRLSVIVGGWMFTYEAQDGSTHQASVNCWGEVSVTTAPSDLTINYPRVIQVSEWVLDNTDAHVVALNHGGEGNAQRLTGWLMAADIDGRGIRPVWAGGAWHIPKSGDVLIVDAQTGEVYRSNGGKPTPIARTTSANVEWDGGFDETSRDAQISWLRDTYLQPHAYQNSLSWFIYNRGSLQMALQTEAALSPRAAESWVTSGALHAVLGHWSEAVHDFGQAASLEPANADYRYYKGLALLAIRDMAGARAEFAALPGDYPSRTGALDHVDILEGTHPRKGLVAFFANVRTNIGLIPMQIWVGPLSMQLNS